MEKFIEDQDILIDVPDYADNQVLPLGRYLIDVVSVSKDRGDRAVICGKVLSVIYFTERTTEIFFTDGLPKKISQKI